jgi:ParB-like chromosome segregation protein Spo0J
MQSVDKTFKFDSRDIPIDNLLLDPNNYRFLDSPGYKKKASSRFHEDKVQQRTLSDLEASYQVADLKQSIISNGFVPMERIIVVPYAGKPDSYLVVEGNRRVASLKSLLREHDEGVISLREDQLESYKSVPCIVLKATGAELKHAERVIMGIRHVAGPKEWGAYQQAVLVSELRDDESLEFRDIGQMLGVSSVEAARRYRAVVALNAMKKDDLYASKAEPAFYRLFHELVSLPGVRDRFGWSAEETRFVDTEAARSFFELICADGNHEPKLQSYGDVRKLKSVVGKAAAEESLFDLTQPLIDAVKIGESDGNTSSAAVKLRDARRILSTISFISSQKLDQDDVEVIEQLIEVLTQLKDLAPTKGVGKSQ